jgi:hypothetical protein
MQDWIRDVEYYLMPSNYPVKGYEEQYQATYECWRAAWEKYRNEIGIGRPLHCDGLLVTHEIGALFYKGECVGLSAFTYGSLSKGPLQHHSWWGGWTPKSIDQLKAISENAIICSQFTVGPKFTGKGHIVRWKEIVFLYLMLRFERSLGEVMAGNLNLTKGVHNACGETSGATVICKSFPYNFQGVDLLAQLVAYEKPKIQLMKETKKITDMCEDLWSRLVHLSDFSVIENNVIPLKKAA